MFVFFIGASVTEFSTLRSVPCLETKAVQSPAVVFGRKVFHDVNMSAPDVTRPEPHAISDSDSELPLGKKKRVSRKNKPAPTESTVAAVPVSNAPTIRTSLAVPATSNQDSRELAEMRSMVKEIKGLTERNAAYVELMAKNEKS